MNWRELLQKSISENQYAKYAKTARPPLLHVLHTQTRSVTNEAVIQTDAITNDPATAHPDLNRDRATAWSQWKAEALNRLFLEQGRTQKRGRIDAVTVEHGERRPQADSSPLDVKAKR